MHVTDELAVSHILAAPSEFILTGGFDGPTNTIKEAMAIGVPVCANRHGGIPELIEEPVTDVLAREGDAKDLSGAPTRREASRVQGTYRFLYDHVGGRWPHPVRYRCGRDLPFLMRREAAQQKRPGLFRLVQEHAHARMAHFRRHRLADQAIRTYLLDTDNPANEASLDAALQSPGERWHGQPEVPLREGLQANHRVGHRLAVRRILRALHPKSRKNFADILNIFERNFYNKISLIKFTLFSFQFVR